MFRGMLMEEAQNNVQVLGNIFIEPVQRSQTLAHISPLGEGITRFTVY